MREHDETRCESIPLFFLSFDEKSTKKRVATRTRERETREKKFVDRK